MIPSGSLLLVSPLPNQSVWRAYVDNPLSGETDARNDRLLWFSLPYVPIYLATREENKDQQARMRAQIAIVSNERYGVRYEPEEITDCDGCRSEQGRLFSASHACNIRKCARQKGVETCAQCSDYICAKLGAFLVAEPEAKARLDEVRRGIS
jgi:hypothetical protein